METQEVWYDVHVHSPGFLKPFAVLKREGYGYEEGGFGWGADLQAYAPQWQRDLARKVFICAQGVFASAEVLRAFIETAYLEGPHMRFRNRRMWQITPELVAYARERNAYPRRNKREREVQTRNDGLIDWLEGLMKEAAQ
jgi:hypothetical protein